MKIKILEVLNNLKSVQPKWIIAAVALVVAAISACFAPLVFASNDQIDSSSRLVTFYDEGVEKTILSKSKDVRQALEAAEIHLGENDKITPAVDTELTDSMTVVNIRRARPVTVIDEDGRRSRVVTAEIDAATIAKQAGIELKPYDAIKLSSIGNFVSDGGVGQVMTIARAKTVNLSLYGQKLTIRTQKQTVEEMLVQAGIAPAKDDTVSVKLSDKIVNGMSMQIWREGIQTIEEIEEVPFETEVINDSSKKLGFVEVQTAGKKGQKAVIYQVNMKKGVEIGREKISEAIISPSVNQVEIRGTKVELPPGSHTDWMRMAGIPESDFGAANFIITKESGWNPQATNRSSGAYGLPQALPGAKMASAGADWQTNPITQLRWFHSYCKGRYGSIQGAYEFWQSNHWY